MAAPAGIDELRHRYAAQPRRYLAPLASALRARGALEEAVTMLRAQLAEYPDHLTGHVVLGQALFDTGALAEAREAFERARALDPGNRVVLRHLGEIASLAGDAGGARLWFGRLRVADPYADDVAAQLGGTGEPPVAYEVDEEVAPVAVAAEHEVAERAPVEPAPAAGSAREERAPVAETATAAPPADAFELLEFDPAPQLDPVVGLDLPPEAPPAELRAEVDDEAAGALEQLAAGPFATETMAGLLAAQGHTEQAVAIYERLAAERPEDDALRARLAALRGHSSDALAAPAPQVTPREVSQADPAPPVPARREDGGDSGRGALLAAAFGDLPRRREGAAAAQHRDLAAAAAPGTADDADPFADVSFDRFFPEPPAPVAAARAPAPAPAQAGDDADLARFDAWLRQAPA